MPKLPPQNAVLVFLKSINCKPDDRFWIRVQMNHNTPACCSLKKACMKILRNIQLTGAENRPFLLDAYFKPTSAPKPVVLFVHGFKGFKDWGHWDLIARQFAEAGYVFIKFNFSHNGTTLNAPTDFDDLEAFGHNNFSKELEDISAVYEWIKSKEGLPADEVDTDRLHLIGHSRGGAISIIYANLNNKVSSLTTWASVARLDYAWKTPEMIEEWKQQGKYVVVNGRTGQAMPIYYQMYLDFKAKGPKLDVQEAIQQLNIPICIIHGTADPAVPDAAAHQLHAQQPSAKLHLIPEADHVFGARHPFTEDTLPKDSQELIEQTLLFLSK